MTIMELERDSFQPVRKMIHFGSYLYECPCCGETVGLWRDPRVDKDTNGMIYKLEQDKNGHVMDWSFIKEE